MTSVSKVKFIVYVLILSVISGGLYYSYTNGYLDKYIPGKNVEVIEQPVAEQISVFEPVAEPILVPPVKVTIEDRNISASIIEVGVAADGSLETPKKWNEAGWYSDGAKPGESGNVIINAHFDDNLGRPAAFWQLKNVTVGDTVLIEDSLSRIHAYQVVDSFLVDINDPSRLGVLKGDEKKSQLTLITCGGVWLPGKSTYDKRLIVKAELIETL